MLLDAAGRIVDFEEKPERPKSNIADGSPSHGEAVLNIARHYAPNALFIRSSRKAEGAREPWTHSL